MILLDLFISLYEWFIGPAPSGRDFQNAFEGVGMLTVVSSIGFALIFYIWLGRWKPVWFKMSHWLITLGIIGALCFGLAIIQSKFDVIGFVLDGYVIKFALINAIFSAIVFFLSSIALKRYSKFSKFVPF